MSETFKPLQTTVRLGHSLEARETSPQCQGMICEQLYYYLEARETSYVYE
jgi:hypothetical protein